MLDNHMNKDIQYVEVECPECEGKKIVVKDLVYDDELEEWVEVIGYCSNCDGQGKYKVVKELAFFGDVVVDYEDYTE